MKRIFVAGIGWLLGLMLAACADETPGSSDRAAGDLRNIPIQDYHPEAMLKTKTTSVERARFPAIDMHNHLGRADSPERIDEIVRAMNETNVVAVANFDGGWGERLDNSFSLMNEPHPGRFIQFMRVDWSKIDEPDFGSQAAAQLQAGHERGARGLKIAKDLGLSVKDGSGELVKIDDPRLDPIWAHCGRLGIPVAIHISDPAAFFTPLDRNNERLVELMDHPDWSFYGPAFPSREELHAQRNAVIERHPETRFLGLHVANNPEDLAAVSQWLDRYPNLYVETGARVSELGRQPYSARRFILQYQDRVLFGTDSPPLPGAKLAADGVEMYRIHWRFFETDDEYFDPAETHHVQGLWRVYGLYLPSEVLEKFYHLNARRLLGDAEIAR